MGRAFPLLAQSSKRMVQYQQWDVNRMNKHGGPGSLVSRVRRSLFSRKGCMLLDTRDAGYFTAWKGDLLLCQPRFRCSLACWWRLSSWLPWRAGCAFPTPSCSSLEACFSASSRVFPALHSILNSCWCSFAAADLLVCLAHLLARIPREPASPLAA